MQAATIASHRFGFSETSLKPLQTDPRGWVLAQFRNPAPLDASGLIGSAEIVPLGRRVVQAALTNAAQEKMTGTLPEKAAPDPAKSGTLGAATANPARKQLRQASTLALQRRWQQVVSTPTPVYERWVMFWANHFCVAATRAATLGLVAPHEREAIRPHATASFASLLRAATLHPAMLLYLDNAQSIGPNSRAGLRRERGLNENLARELLELHTLGVHGGYTQTDIAELAKLLTGWTVARGGGDVQFYAALHEPGDKWVLGKTYRQGPEAVEALFTDLTRHPSTAKFVAGKLARHFVGDEPPAALVDAVAARFRASDGDLMAVAQTLFSHDLAWQPQSAPKFKRPEELVLSAHRLLKLPIVQTEHLYLTLAEMGQAVGRAPSPAGWPDRGEDWLAPDALWKRVEWAGRFAGEHAAMADARQLAALSLGSDLSADTRDQIERADSGAQALALLLASPEFQRR